ncbi:MAG: hypothetical protein IAI50_00570 [Candidatus Eremiobacteraeota bacterium]|nr:hypothetical protein [Candidatus Eremiobacteraeota bacterium]
MKRMFRSAALSGFVLAALLPMPSLAEMAMGDSVRYHRTSYTGSPNLNLTLSLVEAGGGPAHFDATKLVGTLAGASTGPEVAKLTKQYGAENVKSFLATFTYAIDDTLRLVTVNKVALPATPEPNPANGPELAAALYSAGLLSDGKYDVGHMIEHAISHKLHVALMHDIDANPDYGPKKNANFHVILSQAILDLKAEYGL